MSEAEMFGKNEEKTPSGRGAKWPVIVIVLVVALLGFFSFRSLVRYGGANDPYYKTLSDYYTALSKNETNALDKHLAQGFTQSMTLLGVAPSFELFAFESVEAGRELLPVLSPTREVYYCLVTDGSAYLNTAYFVNSLTGPKIIYITNHFTGLDIK